MDGELHPGVARILRDADADDVLPLLADELAGTDLTSLLMEVVRRRAGRRRPGDVLDQYRHDRFVAPGVVDPLALARVELAALETVSPVFEAVQLAPIAPFGTHAALGGVDQNNVLTTIRTGEVAADPTTCLTLEAAVRRRGLLDATPRSSEAVRLAGVSRVVRGQRFDGPRSFAHFSLFGLVTAGRDIGGRRFEASRLVEQITAIGAVVERVGAWHIDVHISDFDGGFGAVVDEVIETVSSDQITCAGWPDRTAGRGYYPNLCFTLALRSGDDRIEVGDGGFLDWTAQLLSNGKERLLTSGISLERLAMIV